MLNRYKIYNRIMFLSFIFFMSCYFLRQYNSVFIIQVGYWLFFVLFLGSSYGVLQASKVQNTYGKGGYLENWYDSILEYRGIEWIKSIFEQMAKLNISIKGESFVFVSPSANKGTYEKVLFQYFSSQKQKSKFIISDLNIIEGHEKNEINEHGEYIYLEGSNNAANIDQILQKGKEQKADIIFDFLGYLWHIKESTWHKKKKSKEEMMKAIEKYNSFLNSNGIIMMDYTKSSFTLILLRQISHFLAKFKFGAGEQSTGAYFMELYAKYQDFKKYVDDNFILHKIDSISEKNIKLSVLILKRIQ